MIRINPSPVSPYRLPSFTQSFSFFNKSFTISADAASATLDELNAPYSAVTVDFNALSESLEAVARHATFNSEEGAVAVKQNKNGILEGIIGEGMTFWRCRR